MTERTQTFLRLLEKGPDSALLRVSLGNEFLAAGDPGAAALHLRRAVEQDPGYSAAWKLLGRALADAGRTEEAADAYREGIRVAGEKGDRQAAKEMQVFLKRLGRKDSR